MSPTELSLARVRALAVILLSLGSLATARVSLAQGKSDGATGPAAERPLEEITVTARRHAESQQTVPLAVTVVSPVVMQSNNIHTLQDIQALIPSMTVTSGNVGSQDQANVTIRGQGWGSGSGTPAVSMYLNEVPIPTDIDGQLAGGPGLLFDLENVQVLKGPQGTLFGRNTMGGAILLQTARPTNDFGGHVQVTYGNYNDREIDSAVNLPIVSDVLLARVAFNGQLRDGYTHVISMPGYPNGLDLNNRDAYSVRGTVTFKPEDAIQNDLIVTYQKYNSHGSADFLTAVDPSGGAAATFPNLVSLLAQQQALGARTLLPLASNENGTGGKFLALENISRFDLGDQVTFRNLIGLHKASFDYRTDTTGTPVAIFDVVVDKPDVDQFSEEAQFLGKGFGGRLDWQAGVFYLDQRAPFARLAVDVLDTAPSDDFHPVDQIRRLTVISKAVYTQGTYDLSDLIAGLKFTAGVRYTSDDRVDGNLGVDPTNSTPTFCGSPPVNCSFLTQHSAHSTAPTWAATLDYQAARDTLLYFTSRTGYRAGGSTTANNGVNFPFGPEYVTDFELGIKSDWAVGEVPVRTNADVYYQNYDKIQVNQLLPYPGQVEGVNVTENAATARVWGAEIEALARVTQNLELGANYDHLSFQYTSFLTGVASAALIASEGANRVPNKYGVNARYHLPIDQKIGDLSLRAYWNWQAAGGDFLGTTQIPAFSVLNLSADWDGIGGEPLDAALFATNALDKTYQTGGIAFLGFVERTYAPPRMYGIRFNYRFGADGK